MQDGPEFMAEEAKYFNYPFPYLYDEVSMPNNLQVYFCIGLFKSLINKEIRDFFHILS